jgi:hypothetical protein
MKRICGKTKEDEFVFPFPYFRALSSLLLQFDSRKQAITMAIANNERSRAADMPAREDIAHLNVQKRRVKDHV